MPLKNCIYWKGLISAGPEPVLSHTENNLPFVSYYRQFSTKNRMRNYKINSKFSLSEESCLIIQWNNSYLSHHIIYSFVRILKWYKNIRPRLTQLVLVLFYDFYFVIRGLMSIKRCYTYMIFYPSLNHVPFFFVEMCCFTVHWYSFCHWLLSSQPRASYLNTCLARLDLD